MNIETMPEWYRTLDVAVTGDDSAPAAVREAAAEALAYIRALRKERTNLRAQIAAVRDLHSRDEKYAAYGVDHCAGCRTVATYTPWPCKTVIALDGGRAA